MLRAVCFVAFLATALAVPHASKLENGRVVGGTDAPAGKYPFMVALFHGGFSCGGTIINEYWVLTAAHCVKGVAIGDLIVKSGTVELNYAGVNHLVVLIRVHEEYDPFILNNDIAVIKVETAFYWSTMVQPVTLPTQNQETPAGSDATIIGWGRNERVAISRTIFRKLSDVSDEECRNAHSDTILTTNICAYYPGGGKGQCSGDSGGPLWVNDTQVGIVSWSEKPCTIAPYPGVFTEVSAYVDWINAHII